MEPTILGTTVQPQPQQQAPAQYSSEAQMNANAGQEQLHKIETVLDNDAYQILQQASSVHAQSIVALGIKLFAKTNLYKEFMLKEDYKTLEVGTEDIVEETSVQVATTAPTQMATTSKTTPSAATSSPSAGGFTSW